MSAYVYILKHKHLPLVKIGKAVNVETRIRQIGAEIDHDASYVKIFESERQALIHERALHKKLKNYRSEKPIGVPVDGSTEWFNQCVVNLVGVLDGFCPYTPDSLVGFRREVQSVRKDLCCFWEHDILCLLEKCRGKVKVLCEDSFLLVEGELARALCEDLMKLIVKPSENSCCAVFTSLTTYLEEGVCELHPAEGFYYSLLNIVKHFTKIEKEIDSEYNQD